MSNWHYQLMKHTEEGGEVWYGIHEYYPSGDGGGWTKEPITIEGETVEDVRWMLRAITDDIVKHGIKDYL